MTARWTGRSIAYLVLALVGLIGTWTFNVLAIAAHRDYLGDWVGSGPAVLSLTIRGFRSTETEVGAGGV